MTAFEPGKTYFTRSVCDHDTIFSITVTRRTAKTIWTECGKTLRVKPYNGVEQVKPHGSYSMCAVIGADRELIDTPEAPEADQAAPAPAPALPENVISLDDYRKSRAA